MPTLQEINNRIHSIPTSSELESSFDSIKLDIDNILSQPDDGFNANYYKNHTGRELFRKLYNFELHHLIYDVYDSGFRPNQSLWTPSIITTDGWWDVSDNSTITEVDGIVTKISDKSGKSIDLDANAISENNHTLLPTELNGLDVVDLDGDDRYNGSSLLLSSGNVSFFVVCKVDVVDAALDSIIATVGSNSFQYQASSNTEFLARLLGPDSTTSTSNTDYIGKYRIFNAAFDLSQSTQYSFVDGTQEGSSVYSSKLTTPTSLRVFTNRGQSEYPIGQLAEIIIVPDVSVFTRQKVEGYLAHKWGLSGNLPTSHLYKSAAPRI